MSSLPVGGTVARWARGPRGNQHFVATDECGYVGACGQWRPERAQFDAAGEDGPKCGSCTLLVGFGMVMSVHAHRKFMA